MNNEKKPRESDVVFRSNNSLSINDLKLQFSNVISEENKIAIIKQANNYGEAGEAWLFDLVATEKNKIQWLAAVLLSHTKNEVYKQLLLEYFAEFIPNNIDTWNKYRLALPNFEINLLGINFSSKELESKKNEIDLSRVNLTQANLNNARLYDANLSQVNLKNSNLTKARFYAGQLNKVYFSEAKLINTYFQLTTIYNTNFDSSCYLDNADFIAIEFKNILFNNLNLQNIFFAKWHLLMSLLINAI